MKLFRGILVAALPVALLAQPAMSETFVRMVSGPSGGSWYPLGAKIMQVLEENIDGISTSNTSGGGISNVLGHQTEDVQSRRRERALIAAQGLQVKLVFPLVICFLPGIFVWTLGPAFYQFLEVIDGIMRDSGSL